MDLMPLSGMKVVDLTQVLSGPYCTMLLGDMGAEVIKVEKYPDGDDTRRMAPFVNGESYCYMMVNRNKKSVRVNLKTDEGKAILYRLVKDADVFVENFRPGVAKRLGLDYETLKAMNPSLIYCSISGYGQTGPYSQKGGFDIMAQGMSGIMKMTGEPGGNPVKVGIAMHDIAAAITAFYNILLAYIYRMKTGKGQYIDVSLVESGMVWMVWEAAAYFGAGEVPSPTGTRHRVLAPYQGFRTKDGYILIGAANQKLWEKFCTDVVERPDWIADERFKTVDLRVTNVDVLEKCIEEVLTTQPSAYWLERLEKAGIPCSPILSFDEAVNDEHLRSRELIVEYEHPVAGKIKNFNMAAKMSLTPGKISSPPPLLGEHTEDVLRGLQYSEDDIQRFKKNGII